MPPFQPVVLTNIYYKQEKKLKRKELLKVFYVVLESLALRVILSLYVSLSLSLSKSEKKKKEVNINKTYQHG